MDWWLQLSKGTKASTIPTFEAIRTVLTPSLSRKTVDSFDMCFLRSHWHEKLHMLCSWNVRSAAMAERSSTWARLHFGAKKMCLRRLLFDSKFDGCRGLEILLEIGRHWSEWHPRFWGEVFRDFFYTWHFQLCEFWLQSLSLNKNWMQWNREFLGIHGFHVEDRRSSSISYANFGIRNLRWTVQSWY